MQSKIVGKKVKKYPCLMQYIGNGKNPFVVLFTKKKSGVVVASLNAIRPVGYQSTKWAMTCFTPFDETIELSN